MKTRKYSRKTIKTRGGYPRPINKKIPFTVSNGNPTYFKPSSAFTIPNTLKEMFILAVIDIIYDEKEHDLFSQNIEVLEEKDAFVQIHRIRGEENSIVFDGNINNWTDEQIKSFVADLKRGDRINIEPVITI